MNFQHRPTVPQDFPACQALMYDRFVYDAPVLSQLTGLWCEILDNEQGVSAVVEDVGADGTRRVLGFGLSMFVSEAFAAELRGGALPYLSKQVLSRHRAGVSPLLDRKAIREDNAGPGLSVITLSVGHVGLQDVAPDVFHGVMGAMLASSLVAHRGYCLREAFLEVYGDSLRDMMQAGGFQLRADFREFFARHSSPPSDEQWPFLMGLTRDEAVATPFCAMAPLFCSNRPRFGFKPGEQDLLKRALRGETDEDLAESLCLSPWTVKKRWQSVYARIEAVSPHLLPQELGEPLRSTRPSRGLERRRHLLNYLREHMEELRPY